MRLVDYKDYIAKGISVKMKTLNAELPVSVAEFKSYAKITGSAEDSVIEQCIKAANNMLFERANIVMLESVVEVEFRHAGIRAVLPNFPVISVEKVELIDGNGTKTELVKGTDYELVDLKKRNIEMNSVSYDRLRVELKAGFAADQQNLESNKKYQVANIAAALFVRNNEEIEKQLNSVIIALVGYAGLI